MKKLVELLLPVLAIGLFVLPGGVFAHHSTSEYPDEISEIEGVVTKKFWKNPHAIFHVVTDQGVEWAVEGSAVTALSRRGITPDLFDVGDRLKVAGRASMRRDNNMIMSNILLADGRELTLSNNGARRWPEVAAAERVIDGPTPEQIAEAEANADGIFRVWSFADRPDWFFGDPDQYPLTQAALDKFATWNEYTGNPQLQCIPPGMPITMGNPYPIEFVQHDENTIVMYAHEFDVTRVIHLNAEPVPTVEETNMGYSTGYWEDENTLVVDTININYPYFNRVGISSGPDLTVHERFIIDDEAGEMSYFSTVTDPWALTEPYAVRELHWEWVPGQQLGTYGCEVSEVYALPES